jgi:hypothetical protein
MDSNGLTLKILKTKMISYRLSSGHPRMIFFDINHQSTETHAETLGEILS